MLTNKVVIVIGGGGLIGREIVKDAIKKNAKVVNCDIAFDTDWNAGTYYLDVTSTDEIDKMISMGYQNYIYEDKYGGVERRDAFIPKSNHHYYDGYSDGHLG